MTPPLEHKYTKKKGDNNQNLKEFYYLYGFKTSYTFNCTAYETSSYNTDVQRD